jgi:hypothetical protein
MGWMLDKIDGERSTLWIAVGTDIALGLEEHDIDITLSGFDAPAVKPNVILDGINPGGQAVDAVTVDRDAPLLNAFLACPAGANARVSEHLLDARSPRVVLVGVGR